MATQHNTVFPRGSTFETKVCSTRTQTGITDQQTAATVTEHGQSNPNSGADNPCVAEHTNWVDCRAVDA